MLGLCVAIKKIPVQRRHSQRRAALCKGALVVNELRKEDLQACSTLVVALLDDSKGFVLLTSFVGKGDRSFFRTVVADHLSQPQPIQILL